MQKDAVIINLRGVCTYLSDMIGHALADIDYSVIIIDIAYTFTCGFENAIWQLLTYKMAISKISGNTVKIKQVTWHCHTILNRCL